MNKIDMTRAITVEQFKQDNKVTTLPLLVNSENGNLTFRYGSQLGTVTNKFKDVLDQEIMAKIPTHGNAIAKGNMVVVAAARENNLKEVAPTYFINPMIGPFLDSQGKESWCLFNFSGEGKLKDTNFSF